MDIIGDGDNFFLRDDRSIESIFKSNNFGRSTTVINELNGVKLFGSTLQTYKWTSVEIMILSWTSRRVRWWACVYFSFESLKEVTCSH